MTAFAAQEASQERLQGKRRREPDEDGFVTVTRGGRNGPARQEAAQEQAEKQRNKQKGFEDFYRFQTREKRKAKAGELLRRFEEDKEKVRRMRERKLDFKVGFRYALRDLQPDQLLALANLAILSPLSRQDPSTHPFLRSSL
jgi:ribosomal RNA-processing protein 7